MKERENLGGKIYAVFSILLFLFLVPFLIYGSIKGNERLSINNNKALPQCLHPKLKQTNLDLSHCGRLLYLATAGKCSLVKEKFKSHWIVYKNDKEAYTSLCRSLQIRYLRNLPLAH